MFLPILIATNLKPIAIVIFVFTYAGIALGRVPGLLINRTGIALLGAIAMILAGVFSIDQAAGYVDYSTLLLLFGLMILSAQLRVAGFYRVIAKIVLQHAKRPLVLLIGITSASAILSSLFSNDIVCLAFTPVICEVTLAAKRNPLPYLISLATASNIGSVATLIGNPQIMFIGQTAALDFGRYTLVMLPVAIFGILANIVIVRWLWRREFAGHLATAQEFLLPAELRAMQPHGYLIGKTMVITSLMLALFLAGLPRDLCALGAAALLMISRKIPAEKLYALVDWNLLMLFVALFVVIGALQHLGVMQQIVMALEQNGLQLRSPGLFVILSTVLSNLVSNVPAVLLLQDLPGNSEVLWYLLAMSSTLAGNLTLLGSIANLIVAEKAAEFEITVSFGEYFKIGFWVTTITLAFGTLWLVAIN